MSYNPLYGSVPYLSGGGGIAYYKGGSGFRTWINNTGNSIGSVFGRNRGKSNSHQFYNAVDYLLDRGYTLDQVKSLIGEDSLHDRYTGDVKVAGDNGKSQYLNNTERIWLNRALAHAQSAGDLRERNAMGLKDLWEGYDTHRDKYFPEYEDEEPEELEGDVGGYEEETPEEEVPQQEAAPAPSGPVEAEMPQEQQNPDFGKWQELYDQIQATLNAQQNPEPEPEPESEPGVTREDLLGMNRQNIRDFRHGRETVLDNGMRIAPTSRFVGRKIGNAVRRNNRYERRSANRNDRNAFRTGILNQPGITYAETQDYDKMIPR